MDLSVRKQPLNTTEPQPLLSYSNFSICVTRLGNFLKFLGTKLLAKLTQIFRNNFGILWKMALFTLNWCGYFLGNFRRKLRCSLLQHLVTLFSMSKYLAMSKYLVRRRTLVVHSVTRKKSPYVYKSCPKMVTLER